MQLLPQAAFVARDSVKFVLYLPSRVKKNTKVKSIKNTKNKAIFAKIGWINRIWDYCSEYWAPKLQFFVILVLTVWVGEAYIPDQRGRCCRWRQFCALPRFPKRLAHMCMFRLVAARAYVC